MQYIRLALLSSLFVLPFASYAGPAGDPAWWFNFGMGTGSNFKNQNAPISSTANVQISFNGRFTPHTFLTIYNGGFSSGLDTYNIKSQYDLGMMYGYISRNPTTYWSASTGICYYKAEQKYGSWNTYSYSQQVSGAGIPIQVQTFWTPFSHFGVGLVGHAVASKDPSLSAMFAIQVF